MSPPSGSCEPVADPAAPVERSLEASPLPADVKTLIALGNAGLLQSIFSLERVSLTQTRIGELRAVLGYARLSGTRTGYEFQDRAIIAPVAVMTNIPIAGDRALFVRGSISASYGTGDKTLQWNDGSVVRSDVQLLYAPTPGTMLGIGLLYQSVRIDNHYTSANILGHSNRDSWGVRLDGAKILSPNWGATIRAQFTKGDNDVAVPSFGYRHIANSDEYYAQGEIVGRFSHEDANWIPEGTALYPVVGANFFYGHFKPATDTFGQVYGSTIGPAEQYGTVWGELRLEKTAKFTSKPQFLPFGSIGIEREYKNKLDALVSEPTYGHGSAGLTVLLAGHRIDLVYNNYFGIHGRRGIEDLVVSTSFRF